MQKAETSTIDAQAVTEKPKVAKLIEIMVDDKQMVYVNWPTDKKELCLTALCESLKLVSTWKPPVIEVAKPSLMDFVRGIKHG